MFALEKTYSNRHTVCGYHHHHHHYAMNGRPKHIYTRIYLNNPSTTLLFTWCPSSTYSTTWQQKLGLLWELGRQVKPCTMFYPTLCFWCTIVRVTSATHTHTALAESGSLPKKIRSIESQARYRDYWDVSIFFFKSSSHLPNPKKHPTPGFFWASWIKGGINAGAPITQYFWHFWVWSPTFSCCGQSKCTVEIKYGSKSFFSDHWAYTLCTGIRYIKLSAHSLSIRLYEETYLSALVLGMQMCSVFGHAWHGDAWRVFVWELMG